MRSDLKVPEKCPYCGIKMRNKEQKLNFKFWNLLGKCYECVLRGEFFKRGVENMNRSRLGGWSIDKTCFDYIRKLLPDGGTILELGSGVGTGFLAKHYNMYSIEHDKDFVNKYKSNYVHAPIVTYDKTDFLAPSGIPGQRGWYDPNIVKPFLDKIEKYDLILVDGPIGQVHGRGGFYKYLHWFNTDVTIMIDDCNRSEEKILLEKVSEKLNKSYIMLDDDTGVIL